MTDTTDTGGKMYSLGINEPQPLNITFMDGSQLTFPLSGKASFTGDVDESARVFFDAVIRHRDSQLEAERQRAEDMTVSRDAMTDKRDTALAKVYELEVEVLKLKGEQVPVAWPDMPFTFEELEQMHGATFANGYVRGWARKCESVTMKGPLFTAPQKPIVLLDHIKISEVVAAVSLEQNRKWNGRVGYMAGWNACIDAAIAGGTVKDGE